MVPNCDDNLSLYAGLDWTKSKSAVDARWRKIKHKLDSCQQVTWPRQNVDPDRWRWFLLNVESCKNSIYMKFGAHIPLSGRPFPHDPRSFPKLKKWQQVAALEVIHQYIKEGKVLGPFPGDTRHCPISGRPLFFYPSFVVPKSKHGSYR